MEEVFFLTKEAGFAYSDLLRMETRERRWLLRRLAKFYKDQQDQMDQDMKEAESNLPK